MAERKPFGVKTNVQRTRGPANWQSLLKELDEESMELEALMQKEIDELSMILDPEGGTIRLLGLDADRFYDLYEDIVSRIQRAMHPVYRSDALIFDQNYFLFKEKLLDCTKYFYMLLHRSAWRIINAIEMDLEKLESDIIYSGEGQNVQFREAMDDCWSYVEDIRDFLTRHRYGEDFRDFWVALDRLLKVLDAVAYNVWGDSAVTHLQHLLDTDLEGEIADDLPAYSGAMPAPFVYIPEALDMEAAAAHTSSSSSTSTSSSDDTLVYEEDVQMEEPEEVPAVEVPPAHLDRRPENADYMRWLEMSYRENNFRDPYSAYLYGDLRLTPGDEGGLFREALEDYRWQRKQEREEARRRREEQRQQPARRSSPRPARGLRH